MRPAEIADTLRNGNITDARSAIIGARNGRNRGGIATCALEVAEELVDSHSYSWPDAIERVRRLVAGDRQEYNPAADAAYEMEG